MIVVVTGMPRCGSTLVMRMLVCAGIKASSMTGRNMEDHRTLDLPMDAAWVRQEDGRCIKVLDAATYRLPAGPNYRFILLTRDPMQQAESLAREATAIGLDVPPDSQGAIAFQLQEQVAAIAKACARLGPLLYVGFGALVNNPEVAAAAIASFAGVPEQSQAMLGVMARRAA